MQTKKILIKIILWLIILILLGAIAYGAFFLYKLNSLNNKISVSQKSENILDTIASVAQIGKKNPLDLKNTDGRINVLLLGVAGKGKPGQNLTDTIMIASLNRKTNQVALLSLPRDLFVSVPDSNWQTKINAVYQFGLNNAKSESEAINPLLSTIKNITTLDIHYYAVLNFDGFTKVIDAVGGVNITNARDLFDARYPGPNYSYETFDLKKGFQHLNGDLALKYARERHDDPEGDFGRAKRQQEIIQATKNKVFSTGTLFNIVSINNLFNALGDNVKTNITSRELESFFELSTKLDTNNIINSTVDAWNKDSLLKVSHVFYGDTPAFILIPRVGNYSEIQDLAQNIFDLNILKRRRDEIANENASVALINKSGDNSIVSKIQKLLSENLVYKNVSVINDPGKDLEPVTNVYDSNSGVKPFTLDEIATRLPAKVSYSVPDKYTRITAQKSPDIVVVIGKDLIDKYAMPEDSIDDFKKAQDDQDYLKMQDKSN
ncbi:MAG: LCP family protein [Candidatus Moranbacteria bacterium]|nr:LCP family protein [Candidatus Moranbacteria bacterium]